MQISSSIKAVTFDVGGTLIEPWPSVGQVYAQVAGEFGLRVAPSRLTRQFKTAWKRRAGFDHSRGAWKTLVDQTFAGLVAEPPSLELFNRIYERFGQAEAWRVFDDVRPALKRLRRFGFKLGIISNWDERLRPLLGQLKLSDHFDAIVISHEAGHTKPALRIFRQAAASLKLRASAVLHVGDSASEDVAGARHAEMKALLLDRSGRRHGSTTASDLSVLVHSLCIAALTPQARRH